MKRTPVIICTILLGLLASTSRAQADPPPLPDAPVAQKTDTADVKGASATCTVSVDLNAIACSLKDTAADKHSVFVEYRDTAGRKYRFNNDDDANSEKTFVNDSMWKGADTSTLQWHVCVNVRWNNDRCSNYVNYAVNSNALSFDLDCRVDAATCNQLQNLPKDDGWQLSRECAQGALATAVGLAKDGKAAVGRGLLKKVPGVGWAYTAYGVTTAVSGCR
jgi:hypothetical protein